MLERLRTFAAVFFLLAGLSSALTILLFHFISFVAWRYQIEDIGFYNATFRALVFVSFITAVAVACSEKQ